LSTVVQALWEWQFQAPELEVQERRRAAVAQAFAGGQLAGIAESVAELALWALPPVAPRCPAANLAVQARQVVPRQQSAFAIPWR